MTETTLRDSPQIDSVEKKAAVAEEAKRDNTLIVWVPTSFNKYHPFKKVTFGYVKNNFSLY